MFAPHLKARARLEVQRLEERLTPATSGVTWPDGAHLTLSFVPDGTPVGTSQSSLFATLNAEAPAAVWQREILRAFQAWAATTNVNVGVVPDSGAPLGAPGAVQGDKQFGDIRIAAVHLPPGTVMTNTAFQWSGTTWSGDVLINTDYPFSVGQGQAWFKLDLYTAMLNEAGNVLGVVDSLTDWSSGVFHWYIGAKSGIDANDVADIQSLYGARSPDGFDAVRSNDYVGAATNLGNSPEQLTQEADITTASDQDYYKFSVPGGKKVTGVTVTAATAGLSALQGSLQVYNSWLMPVGSDAASSPGEDLSVRLTGPQAGASYYVRVAGNAAGQPFNVGGYQLKVVFQYADGTTSDGAANGPNTGIYSGIDNHTNDTITTATNIAPRNGNKPDARFDATYTGSISDRTDVDFYKIHSPSTGTPQKMNLLVWGLESNGLVPQAAVYDAAYKLVPFTLLGNEGGTFSLEVANTTPGAIYYVQVAANYPGGSRATGSYQLGINFSTQHLTALSLQTYAGGTLTQSGNQQSQTLTVWRNTLFEFDLSARSAQQWTDVRMEILDADGAVVFTLDAYAGAAASTGHVYLAAGSYIVRYTAATADGSSLGGVDFTLTGREVSDPIGLVTSGYYGGSTWGSTSCSTTTSIYYSRPYYF